MEDQEAGSLSAAHKVGRKRRDEGAARPPAKRKRRVLSCQSCQRLKCRCEYDHISRTCRRCRTLRLACSLGDGDDRPPPLDSPGREDPSIEQRLNRHEHMLSEVKELLHKVLSQTSSQPEAQNASRRSWRRASPGSGDSSIDIEDISDPADQGLNVAPAVVMREVDRQLAGGYRRLLQNVNFDLVTLDVGLDEESVQELFDEFLRSKSVFLIAYNADDPDSLRCLRNECPFLYSVCCLVAMGNQGSQSKYARLHRTVYEQVRLLLGQVLLASPLPLGYINAIFIMACSCCSPTQDGTEYLDSWMLSGFCAQQAMLSISFSDIVENVKKGISTERDYRSIKLWVQICLNHLQWAATTGRHPAISTTYLNQCNILLNIVQANMQDGMDVAQVLLYRSLHRKLSGERRDGDPQDGDEFASWKKKWIHLFALPGSSILKISYFAAHLILASRSLDAFNDENGKTPLSIDALNLHSPSTAISNPSQESHEAHVCKYAYLILQTFVEMSLALMQDVPSHLFLCISYSALVITHYNPGPNLSESAIRDVLKALGMAINQGSRSMPISPIVTMNLARRKYQQRHVVQSEGVNMNMNESSDHVTTGPGPLPHPNTSLRVYMDHTTPEDTRPETLRDALSNVPGLDLLSPFPTMEDFFVGGYMDYMPASSQPA